MWNKNDPANNIWRTRDVTEMAAALKTAPIYIDEVKGNFNQFVKVSNAFSGKLSILKICSSAIHLTYCLFSIFLSHLYQNLLPGESIIRRFDRSIW